MAALAAKLGCSVGDAFLNWFRVYVWLDSITESGDVPFLSPENWDSLSHACPGTCAALASDEVGWLHISNGKISVINWDRHCGESAKKRANASLRKKLYRGKVSHKKGDSMSRNCPTKSGTREEKRRDIPPTPLGGVVSIGGCDKAALLRAEREAVEKGLEPGVIRDIRSGVKIRTEGVCGRSGAAAQSGG